MEVSAFHTFPMLPSGLEVLDLGPGTSLPQSGLSKASAKPGFSIRWDASRKQMTMEKPHVVDD